MKRVVSLLSLLLVVIFFVTACESPQESQSPSQSQGGSPSGGQSQSPGQSAAQAIQPKQLISKDDAAKLLGESLKEGVEGKGDFPGMNTCFYAPGKPDSKSYLMIAILQKGESEGQQGGGQQSGGQQSGGQQSGGQQSGGQQGGQQQLSPKKVFEALKKVFSDPNQSMTGFIGDDKFLMSPGMGILSGESCIYISVGSSDPAKAQQLLKQAAELAVTNLKRIQGK